MNEEIATLLGLSRWFPPTSQDPRKIWRDEYSRIAAAKNLANALDPQNDSATFGALCRAAFCDENEQVRYAALESLVEIGPVDRVIPILYAMIFDEHSWIREYAFGLLESRAASVFRQAADHLQHDEDEDLSRWASGVVKN